MNTRHVQGIGMTSQRTRNRLIDSLREMGIENETVLSAIASIPRHLFIDEALSTRAYENISLPIGHGQTISQPYIVAKMTELAITDNHCAKVLEVGTGSGYQTAVLSSLYKTVFTVERILPLLTRARERFRQLRLSNILTHHSDGSWGWEQKAPYDAIVVTAAPQELPESLLDQLAENGKLVIPAGMTGNQKLYLYTRNGENISKQAIEPVSFVPLLSGVN